MIFETVDMEGGMIGGVFTFIKNMISMSPDSAQFSLIGINSTHHTLYQTYRKSMDGVEYDFIPITHEQTNGQKRLIPATLRYTLSLWRNHRKLQLQENDTLCFQRIEYAIPFLKHKSKKVVFLHNQIKDFISTNSESKWKWFKGLYWAITGPVLKHMDTIYFVERNTLGYYQKKYPQHAHKMFFCPTMYYNKVFYPYTKEDRDQCIGAFENTYHASLQNKDVFLFVGRFEKQKNPELLVEVIHGYLSGAKKREDAVFVLIGDGSYRPYIEKNLAKWIEEKKVILTGSQQRDAIARWMNVSYGMVLTSHFEGMPIAVLEAMGCGVMLVSTNVGEIRNMVKDGVNGIVVNTFDSATFIKALEEAVQSRETYDRKKVADSIQPFQASAVVNTLIHQMEKG